MRMTRQDKWDELDVIMQRISAIRKEMASLQAKLTDKGNCIDSLLAAYKERLDNLGKR